MVKELRRDLLPKTVDYFVHRHLFQQQIWQRQLLVEIIWVRLSILLIPDNTTPITLEFYVDKNYNALKFMESWMEFIASGSHNPVDSRLPPVKQNSDAYLFRMQYPEYYKSNETKITKFDRDYNQEIEYTFRGLFPSAMASLPVSYSASNILTMAVTFQYDRYIAGKSNSLSDLLGNNNNFVRTL
jgi:hypothetical protein